MTLTHFNSIDWADSAMDTPRVDGISRFGEEVVQEMNRLGMMVDISHVSPAAMSDVLEVSKAPVIFSHSSARAITNHVRNVPDSILLRLAPNGGVVMVAFIPEFISESVREWGAELFPLFTNITSLAEMARIQREYADRHGPSPRATVADIADHIEHIARVTGVDHVGIGADFYGAEAEAELVQGVEDVSKYPVVIAELVRRGWADEDLKKIARGNLLRVFAEVEQISAGLRRTTRPASATIDQLDRPRVP